MLKKILFYLLIPCFTACSVSPESAPTPEPDSIPVELTTQSGGQQVFFEGDEIQFLLSLGSDAYIYMYHIDARNKLLQILPSDRQLDNHYRSGYFLTIPEYQPHYRFRVKPPFGEQTIWIFASDHSLDLDIEVNDESIESIRRDIKQASRKAYGEYELKLMTRKR